MSDESFITYDDFAKVEMRAGRVISVEPFPRARNPSYKVEIDLGEIGTRWSSAQVTSYAPDELIGKTVICVVNLAPRNIAGFQSQVLMLGVKNAEGEVKVLTTAGDVVIGHSVF